MLQRTMLFFVRIVLFAFGFVFAASFLVAGVILALITSVAALLSGQRPVWRVRQGSGARRRDSAPRARAGVRRRPVKSSRPRCAKCVNRPLPASASERALAPTGQEPSTFFLSAASPDWYTPVTALTAASSF